MLSKLLYQTILMKIKFWMSSHDEFNYYRWKTKVDLWEGFECRQHNDMLWKNEIYYLQKNFSLVISFWKIEAK